MTQETGKQGTGKVWEQKLSFYHPAASGNGVALQVAPRINRKEGDRYNCFFLDMAAQKGVAGGEEGKRAHAVFDWENRLTVKMDFGDLCELLLVLEGLQEKIGGAKNGLYHDTGRANTVITFGRIPEKGGYSFGLSRKDKDSGQLTRLSIGLSEAEAIGLRCVIQAGLFFITFHTHLFSSPTEPA